MGSSFNVEVVEEPIMHGEENVGHMENCDHDGLVSVRTTTMIMMACQS